MSYRAYIMKNFTLPISESYRDISYQYTVGDIEVKFTSNVYIIFNLNIKPTRKFLYLINTNKLEMISGAYLQKDPLYLEIDREDFLSAQFRLIDEAIASEKEKGRKWRWLT